MTLGNPSGPLDAEIVLCGRDYGFEEVAAGGRPFVGAAGKVLDRALAKAGLERGRCLVTNVVNARPISNRWEAHHATDIAAGVEALHTLLALHPRKLVVALGAEAFQACRGVDVRARPELEFDGNGITELRGYVFDGPFGPVLAATHPAFVLRTWLPWWPLLCWDLAKAKKWVDGRGGVAPSREHFMASLPPPEVTVAVDTETSGDHAERIECVGWAWDAENGYAIPFNESTRDFVAELLASPNPKVFCNGQFDNTVLARNGLRVNNWTDDVQLQWHVVEPLLAGKKKEKGDETVKSLRFLLSLLTDRPFHKFYNYESAEDRLRLCAKDCSGTWACWDALRRRL